MKKSILYIPFVCLFVPVSLGTYTHTITTYQLLPDLTGTESMLITGQGGGGGVNLFDNSFMKIESTSMLGVGTGGVWQISMSVSSRLEMTGGEVHMIDMDDDSTAVLKSGWIEEIRIDQLFFKLEGDPPAEVPNPHITLYYWGDLPTLDVSNVLTGLWSNGDSFEIQLFNDTGIECNLLDNFDFILVPEPATLLLLTLGGLMIRRRTSAAHR